MRLSDVLKFQKALALAASTSNPFEAQAAELAARRLMESGKIDPTWVSDTFFLSRHINLGDHGLLPKLREEYRAQHPHLKRCEAPGCEHLFDPKGSRRRFCCDGCRQKAYRSDK